MMNLMDLEPYKMERTLKGYSLLIYGEPKSGKTYNSSKFEKSLILAFEIGYRACPGVMALPVNSWTEFKKVLRQLKDAQVKEKFYNICIDTVDLAFDACEKYICNVNGVDDIGKIPYGAGYGLLSKEFDEALQLITRLDYGLILISHSKETTFTNENGIEYNKIVPTIPTRGRLICERLCDIIAYSRIVDTNEGAKTKLYLRGTPRFVAGSRFKYITDVIDFTYERLVDAIGEAIDKQEQETNDSSLFIDRQNNEEIKELDFDNLMDEFNSITQTLMDISKSNGAKIIEKIEKIIGKGKKVNELDRSQVELLDLINYELKELI